jgi:hypothetical protein
MDRLFSARHAFVEGLVLVLEGPVTLLSDLSMGLRKGATVDRVEVDLMSGRATIAPGEHAVSLALVPVNILPGWG